MRPKVSIVVPVYNVEKYLDRCIDSIVGQTLQDIEIILVDDESPDNCPVLCDNWANKDVRIKVVHKQNEGLGLSRNAGLGIASGEFVAFVDSDDYIENNMYECLYNECKNNKLDCIFSEFNIDDYPGFRVVSQPEKIYIGRNEIEQLRLDIIGAEPSYISGVKYHCSACKGLYLLDTIKNHNLLFKSEREYISEDMLFNLDFLYFSERVKIVPWQLYHYCLNNNSLTHSYRPDRWRKKLLMLQELDDKDRFEEKAELALRLKRTTIFYTMSAIAQILNRYIPFREKVNEIAKIENEPAVVNAVNNYPISKLPLKWKLYTFLLKQKLLRYTIFIIGKKI